MGQVLRDRSGRELPLPDVLSVEEGVMSLAGDPLFLLGDSELIDPGLMDLLAGAVIAVDPLFAIEQGVQGGP